MPEIHLKQPGFTHSARGPFSKNKESIQKFIEAGDASYIYKNKLDNASFQHDMAYGDFKYLARRTASDWFLRDKAFNIAKYPKYHEYQRRFASIVCQFFYKKSPGSGVNTHGNKSAFNNEKLAEELHKPIIRKFKKRSVYSRFKDIIWSVDLADMQIISKFNKGFRFLLCAIDIFSKYAWVFPLKIKEGVKENKGVSVVNAFQRILDGSNKKLNKIWFGKWSEFYNSSFKIWLKDNDIEMYSIHNEGKSIVAERFVRTLKTKIYKYLTSISKYIHIDKLDHIVNEYNNTYHRTIKIKSVDGEDNTILIQWSWTLLKILNLKLVIMQEFQNT